MSNTENIIEELSFRVKDAPYDYLLARAVQRLVTLNSENAQLKARIAHIEAEINPTITKAKEQSCSTLCHPEEECFITESGKCEAKGE